MWATPNTGCIPESIEPQNVRSAATVSTQNTPLQNEDIGASVIALLCLITLDWCSNTLWRHWKVVNEIAFFICASVFANKSNTMNQTPQLLCVVWRDKLVHDVPKGTKCPVSSWVTVEGCWERWGVHIVPASRRANRRLLSKHMWGVRVTKDRGVHLKSSYW